MSARSHKVSLGLDRFSGLYLAGLCIIVFGIWMPDLFLTTSTVKSIASQQAITAMVALAILLPLAAGHFDLSVGANINFSTILVTVLQTSQGWGMAEAMLMGVLAGLVIGCVNGLIVVRLHLSSFIATLGMATIVTALQTIVSGTSQPPPIINATWLSLTQRQVFGLQIIFYYMLVLAVVLWWILERTPAGRYIYAVGSNTEAARLSGVRTDYWTFVSLMGSGLICGVIGVLYASLNGPSLTFGSSLLLPAFAAAFLGSTQLLPGRFNAWGTVVAVFVLAIGIKGMQLAFGVQWISDMFNGVALIMAVAFAVWRQRVAVTSSKKGQLADRAPECDASDDPSTDAGLVGASTQPRSRS
jgi:ribose transport system permease protein